MPKKELVVFLADVKEFWVDAFMLDHSSCNSNSDCANNRDMVWLDGTEVAYNASLYNLVMENDGTHCTKFVPKSPQTSSSLNVIGCSDRAFPVCSAPCDDESKLSWPSRSKEKTYRNKYEEIQVVNLSFVSNCHSSILSLGSSILNGWGGNLLQILQLHRRPKCPCFL